MRTILLFAVLFTACGPVPVLELEAPADGDPCTRAQFGDTVCVEGTQIVCESTIDPAIYLWFHNGPCFGNEGPYPQPPP